MDGIHHERDETNADTNPAESMSGIGVPDVEHGIEGLGYAGRDEKADDPKAAGDRNSRAGEESPVD